MSVFPFIGFLFIIYKVLPAPSETFNAVLPKSVTALKGSCVQIPCTFEVSGFQDKLKKADLMFACWIKKNPYFTMPDSLVVFNGSHNVIRGFSHIEILGNLTQHECTTVFYDVMNNHSDIYYFRLQMEPNNVFRATFLDSPVNISVSDSPQPPDLKPRDLKPVMEGSTVNLTCSAEAPCPKQPPTLSWSDIPESANITTQLQENPDKTQSVFSQMIFKASYMDHRKNISCTVTYPRHPSNTTVKSTVMLRVQFSPKETRVIIKPSASLSVGTNVTLTCKTKANPSNAMTYTWYKRGEQKHLDFVEQITFNVSRTSGGWYFCSAKNKYGVQMSEEFQLIVEESFMPLITGCAGGVSALVLLFLLAVLFRRVQRAKTSNELIVLSDQGKEKHTQINSIYANPVFMIHKDREIPKDENDSIHYGEIDLSSFQANCAKVKHLSEETVYAVVCSPGKEMNQDSSISE